MQYKVGTKRDNYWHQRRNFGLKSGGTKLDASKAPRIETSEALRKVGNGEGIPPPLPPSAADWGSSKRRELPSGFRGGALYITLYTALGTESRPKTILELSKHIWTPFLAMFAIA